MLFTPFAGAEELTLLAASFRQAKVTKIITNNAKDYEMLGAFEVVGFR